MVVVLVVIVVDGNGDGGGGGGGGDSAVDVGGGVVGGIFDVGVGVIGGGKWLLCSLLCWLLSTFGYFGCGSGDEIFSSFIVVENLFEPCILTHTTT